MGLGLGRGSGKTKKSAEQEAASEALESMGVRQVEGPGHILEAPDGLKPTSIYLYEASVTGTETALLAAAGTAGTTEIRHAACEPHVVELCAFLEQLGVGISGAGTTTIRIEGGGTLHGAEHKLWGDYIEAGSWAVVAAVTAGEIEVHGARSADMEVVAAVEGAEEVAEAAEEAGAAPDEDGLYPHP